MSGESPAWEKSQVHVYTKWANRILVAEDIEIEDIQEDVKDGIILCKLLMLLTKQKFKFRTVIRRPIHATENLTIALGFLEHNQKVKMVNIGAGDLNSGNLKIVLALFWTIVLRYQPF